MKLFIACICLFQFTLYAQSKTDILSYDVHVRLNENDNSFNGKISISLTHIANSQAKYIFSAPKKWNVNSIEDPSENSFDFELIESESIPFQQYEVELPSSFSINDTLRMVISFTAVFDSLSSKDLFLSKKEFVLVHSETESWLPNFGASSTEQFSLEFTTPITWTLFAEDQFDTLSSDNKKIWSRKITSTISLSSAFTFYGMNNATMYSVMSSDSLTTVSIHTNPENFNQQYASAQIQQLRDAIQYFSTLTNRTKRPFRFTFAAIGTGNVDIPIFTSNQLLILRNSPAYSVFDSTLLMQSSYNRWLRNLAFQFAPAANDSLGLLSEGFASYLTMRFLISTFPLVEKNERLFSLSRALSFLPNGKLADKRIKSSNTKDLTVYKGRYFFLMLEYLLGRESFDTIIRTITSRFSTTDLSITQLRLLCEEEYGSSLEWFFEQWLTRSSAPEFVMEWRSEKTPRGMFVVKVIIEQRGDNFSMPITLLFTTGKRVQSKRIFSDRSKQEFTFTFPTLPEKIELDPQYQILRWLLEVRISAHAYTSLLFLSMNRDVANAEREALYTLQLDPNNSTGSAVLASFVLGNIFAAHNDFDKAKEYFFKAMSSSSTTETEQYKIMSLIRFGNIVEMEGKRDEALQQYQRALIEGKKNPVIFERAIIEAEKYLLDKFIPVNDIWFDSF